MNKGEKTMKRILSLILCYMLFTTFFTCSVSASDYSDNADIHNVNDFFEIIDININDVEYLAQNNSDDEFYEFALSGDFLI